MNKNMTTAVVAIVALVLGAAIGAAGSGGARVSTVTSTTTLGAGSVQAAQTTITSTLTSTLTDTVTTLRLGAVVANFSGSGDENSPPFTASSSAVKVTVNATEDPQVGLLSWYIYPVNSPTLYVAQGDVNGQSGTSSSFGYGLTPGQEYFVSVISANTVWSITVQPAG